MLPISLSFSSVHFLTPDFSCSISFSCSIVSIFLFPLVCFPFHLFQFLFNLPQYSSLYILSNHPNNFFAVNLPSNSSLSNTSSSCFCFAISSWSHQYSFSNSLIASCMFFKFSLPSQVSNSAVNPFQHTKYLSFPLIYCLFRIFSTSYSSSPSIITVASYSFLCPSTCLIYLYILLTLTTRCILIVLGSSNSTAFDDMIFFTL